jgi:hypothetical protein
MAGSPLGHPAIEAHSSRASRWLRERRLRLALWIAVLEGIVVAVVVIAGLVLLVYMALRDRLHWDAGRQILWVVAASQVMALLVVILAFVVGAIALVLVVLFAIVALVYLFSDLRHT